MTRNALYLAPALVGALTLAACGDSSDPEDCGVGDQCECITTLDCPDPLVEECQAPVFGQPGVCVAVGGSDVGTDTDDAGPDATADAGDDTTPDVGDDTTPDVAPDTAVDAETSPDVIDDADDATDAADDADTTDTADTDVDSGDTADTDDVDTDTSTGVDRTPYEGWVAYQTFGAAAVFDRVHLISGDGADGPFLAPIDTAQSLTRQPSFSPDGTEMVFVYGSAAGTVLRVATLATSAVNDLLGDDEFRALRMPRFSPDGDAIAFNGQETERGDAWNIYVLDLTTDSVTRLTDLTSGDAGVNFVGAPAWNADGTQIYYTAGTLGETSTADIWVMDADGTDATQLTTGANPVSIGLHVRPDGSELMFDDATQPQRLGLVEDPPTDGVGLGDIEPVGLAGTDANCQYVGNSSHMICERHQTPTFANCVSGAVNCTPDICVVDIETGATVVNLTQSPTASDTFPTVTAQPFEDIDVDGFSAAP